MIVFSLVTGYVGPGAGFAFFSTALVFLVTSIFLLMGLLLVPFRWTKKIFTTLIPSKNLRWIVYILLIAAALWFGYSSVRSYFKGPQHPRMIVLGMDGLDPDIVRSMVKKGELPNFKRLIERGTMRDLRVPNPPISPTSWASFITGTNPGRHGILGFIGRNPDNYLPRLFTKYQAAQNFLNLPSKLNIPFSKYQIPLVPSKAVNTRQGQAFWKTVSERGIQSTIVKVPVTFPPEQVEGKMLSGLGTPDLLGTQGTFYYWTEKSTGSSGEQRQVQFTMGTARSEIVGPKNTLLDDPEPTAIPISFSRTDTGVSIRINERKSFFLEEGKWSEWKVLRFSMGLGMSVTGVSRFHLNQLDPFSLYMTPIQINPKDPVMAISHPASYSQKLAKRIGYFYTMGMPQDDSALKAEKISDTTFIEQSYQGLRERRRIFGLELRRERNGLLVGVFDTTDRIQHLFWRHRDPKHPLYEPDRSKQFQDVIPDVYRKMDEILGEVLDSVDESVPIVIVSDHGFTSFRRQFHVNEWLKQNGYLEVKDHVRSRGRYLRSPRGGFYVDWSRTEAYQLGLTGIFLNVEGREAKGKVPYEKKWSVARKIRDELENVRDPKTGKKVFKNVYLSKNIYEGLFWQGGPDLILGYNKGYRTSWKSARGELSDGNVLTNNLNKWSGDHIIDNSLVAGTLITSFPLDRSEPRIEDVAATVYDYYDINYDRPLDGRSLLGESE